VIPAREVLDLRAEWSLAVDVIEKDYMLGWLLAGIASEPQLREGWVFKGGTCLRKCYYETYRFSEDLDFTVRAGGPETPEELEPLFVVSRRGSRRRRESNSSSMTPPSDDV
jgi:predicted nucleotidyltransferase component of viral defense system